METTSKPRKANDCIAAANRAKPARQLFDEFWREGELALFFGAAGTGKSILAVQVADALARGTPLHGFVMPRGRRKVLYVDLSLTDAQFRARYGPFKFAQNLYRGRPPAETDLCDWIKASVEANGFKVVIVDDLSAIKRTHDGIRETLACMRRLRRLRDELGISILAVTDAFEPKDGWVGENDLMRSRVLCTVADSVFAIGRIRRTVDGRRIVQTRTRAAKMVWTGRDAPDCEIKRLENGMLAFEFDERFEPEIDDKTLALVRAIHSKHSSGASFRLIADELGISKSGAHKLYKRWKTVAERMMQDAECTMSEDEDDDWDETSISDAASEWLSEECSSTGARASRLHEHSEHFLPANDANSREMFYDPTAIPFAAGLGRRSIYDLEYGFDAYGREIFVESREEHTGKPTVWYQIDRRTTRRFTRGTFGIQVEHLNTGPFL